MYACVCCFIFNLISLVNLLLKQEASSTYNTDVQESILAIKVSAHHKKVSTPPSIRNEKKNIAVQNSSTRKNATNIMP